MKADVPRPLSAERLGGLTLGYAGAFLAFLLLVALLQWSGTPERTIGILFLCFALVSVPVFGMLRRPPDLAAFTLAERRVGAVNVGRAAATEAIAPAVLFAAAGLLPATDQAGLVVALAFASASVLATVLITPFLRRLGGFTVADFLADRFGGGFARLLAAVVVLACAWSYLVGLTCGAATIGARLLDMDYAIALYAVLAAIALGALLGGLRAAVALQASLFFLIVIGLVAVAIFAARTFAFDPAAFSHDGLIETLDAFWASLTTLQAGSARTAGLASAETGNLVGLTVALVFGAAAMPSMLLRATITPTVREARTGGAWTVVFLFLLSAVAITYVALSNSELNVEVTGIIAILIATLGLIAIVANACGLVLVIAMVLAHDLLHKLIVRKVSPNARLIMARVLVILVAGLTGYVAPMLGTDGSAVLAWAFALAASALFPALVLGIWSKRAGTTAGLCSMLAGFAACVGYIAIGHYAPQTGIDYLGMSPLPATAGTTTAVAAEAGWFGLSSTSAVLFGLPIGVLVAAVLARFGGAASDETKAFVDAIRRPRGGPQPSPAAPTVAS